MKARLADAQEALIARTKEAAKATDEYSARESLESHRRRRRPRPADRLVHGSPLAASPCPESPPGDSRGCSSRWKALAATLVAIAHTRLDLLASDLEEERAHLLSLLRWRWSACFSSGLARCWRPCCWWPRSGTTHRLLVLGLLAGAFLTAGVAARAMALSKARSKPKLFAASLSELRKDRQQLTRS